VQLDSAGFFHLTYCTNIHPGNGWAEVDANIRRFGPALKQRLAPHKRFGLGLRLSARDARELLEGRRLEEFRAFLDAEGLYVALINGFPHGSFHRTAVKADVYAPDWRDDERVRYTLDLVTILSRLLPPGMDGGVSTAPLSYKPWLALPDTRDWHTLASNVVRVVEQLVIARRERATFIHLDIEPEPDCLIEHSDEFIAFFERFLLPHGAPLLASALGCGIDHARVALQDHVRICLDCCHFAVEFEDPAAALERLQRSGIKVGRVQLSSALRVIFPHARREAAAVAERLQRFADSTYLHQVIERRDGHELRHFADLDQALAAGAPAGGAEWRIHFHVPLFAAAYDGLGSTQDYVRTILAMAATTRFAAHFEIETYTWDVLPAGLKIDLLDSIGREYEWVLDNFPVNNS
jgi:sugar phosphate isomerase/epimerase